MNAQNGEVSYPHARPDVKLNAKSVSQNGTSLLGYERFNAYCDAMKDTMDPNEGFEFTLNAVITKSQEHHIVLEVWIPSYQMLQYSYLEFDFGSSDANS